MTQSIELTHKPSIYHRVLSLFSRNPDKEVIKNHFEAKKIKSMEEADFKELAKNLRIISFSHFGIQAPISDFAMMAIMDMLQDYYADLSAEDIHSAFKACAAGEYMDADGKSILKPYGAFSVQFIGQVLNGYSRNKINILKKANDVKRIEESKEPKKYVTNETVYNKLEEYYKAKGELPIYWLWESAYLHLLEIGKVKEVAGYEDRQQELFRHLKQSLTV